MTWVGAWSNFYRYRFWHLNDSPRFARYFTLLYLIGISLVRATFWAFWQKDLQNFKLYRYTLVGRALPCAKLSLLSHCLWKYLVPFDRCWCTRKKARIVNFTYAWRMSTKLSQNVRLAHTITLAKFHCYNSSGFIAVRFLSVHLGI